MIINNLQISKKSLLYNYFLYKCLLRNLNYVMKEPQISILVAARNEEKYILACLQALDRLDYPTEKLEIWIGNDLSTDQTEKIIREFIAQKPHFQLVNITENRGTAQGKANVLAQLAEKAKGDFFLMTDADTEVQPTWIKAFLPHLSSKIGIITGFTLVRPEGFLGIMQYLDWLLGLGLIHFQAVMGIPLTAMGNNMLISREAYWATGGYAHLPFSVTEDFALFEAVLKKGFSFKHICQKEILAQTQALPNLTELLAQRKRWLKGAIKIRWFWKFFALLVLAFLPLLILAFLTQKWLFWFLLCAKTLFDFSILLYYSFRIGKPFYLLFFPFYEIYTWFFNFAWLLSYLFKPEIKWKKRQF